jgi:phosphomevalonate kinase
LRAAKLLGLGSEYASSSSSTMSPLVVSAPGKVLLAGGYLVLDPAYSGVVVSTSSRFYTVVSPGNAGRIIVRSPQFINAAWSYAWSFSQPTPLPSVLVSQLER